MATLLKIFYLIVCFVVSNGIPRGTFKNAVSQTSVDNSRLLNVISHGRFSTYTSYGALPDFNFGDLQYRLNSILAYMLQCIKLNFPVILINPQNVFGGYLPPDFVATADNQNGQRTPNYFPTTNEFNRPTPQYPPTSERPTSERIPSSETTPTVDPSTKPTTESTPSLSSRGTEIDASEATLDTSSVEDDYDDYTRPIVLRGPSSIENEVSDLTSRPAPNVEHGSVQAGS